jgi:hypothetical protein
MHDITIMHHHARRELLTNTTIFGQLMRHNKYITALFSSPLQPPAKGALSDDVLVHGDGL